MRKLGHLANWKTEMRWWYKNVS